MISLNIRRWYVYVLLFSLSSLLHATEETKTAYIAGNVDFSYNYLVRDRHFIGARLNRFNDYAMNGFSVQQANATFAYLPPQGFGVLSHLIFGRDAFPLAQNGYNPDVFDNPTFGLMVAEAYMQYQLHQTTFTLGQIQSPAGYEQLDYSLNSIFSNSILYGYAEPGVQTGAFITQAINEQLSLNAGISNGWDTIKIAGQMNSFDLGLTYKPVEQVCLSVAGFLGHAFLSNNMTTSGSTSRLNYINMYATWYATPKLEFAINADYAVQQKAILPTNIATEAKWRGITGYVDYKIMEKWLASARMEIFDDADGFRTGVRQNWREATISLAYKPTKHWQIRAGTRHDFSNKSSFINKSLHSTNANQQSYAVDTIFIF